MRPAVSRCDSCRRQIRESERRDLDAPARRGEPAMFVRGGACVKCALDSDANDRDETAMWETRISEAREGL